MDKFFHKDSLDLRNNILIEMQKIIKHIFHFFPPQRLQFSYKKYPNYWVRRGCIFHLTFVAIFRPTKLKPINLSYFLRAANFKSPIDPQNTRKIICKNGFIFS